jgi:mRNA-degrading endonuclease toxin of MazEF toxin-antitoxin module
VHHVDAGYHVVGMKVPDRAGYLADMVKRGEVWLATLDPTIGSEIRKISPNEINDHLRTVTVAPMTSASRRLPIAFRCASTRKTASS